MMLAPDSTTTHDLVTAQRKKERKAIRTFLLWSLLGSAAFHAIVMASAPTAFWNSLPDAEADTIEVVVEPEVPIAPEKPEAQKLEQTVHPPEPDVVPEVAPEMAFAPPPPPLAPTSQALQPAGEDAPTSHKSATPASEVVNPITSKTGEDAGLRVGGGPIFDPFGKGFGFGIFDRPTGFNPSGKPDGDSKGIPGGTPTGTPDGTPNSTATRTTAPSSIAPPTPNQPVCLSCPKPVYQGAEGSPRVDMRIRPDGSVEVRLRKSSGNPETDRETLETMSKWRFDPKTVPEGGIKKRVRVEYEEEGSNYQQQNKERRRREAAQQQLAEQEQQRQEAERQRQQPQQAIETPAKSAPTPAPAPAEKPTAPPEPAPTPVVEAPPPAEPAPAPPEVTPPPPSPVPVPAVESPPASSSN